MDASADLRFSIPVRKVTADDSACIHRTCQVAGRLAALWPKIRSIVFRTVASNLTAQARTHPPGLA